MTPLIGVALQFLPDLMRFIGPDGKGGVAANVAKVVETVTGTNDPVLGRTGTRRSGEGRGASR